MHTERLLVPIGRLTDCLRAQQLTPSRTFLLLLAVLVSSSSSQSVPGYSNVTFISQPQDVYSIVGTTAFFECEARGIAIDSGNYEPLAVLVYFNDLVFDKYGSTERMLVKQANQEVGGLLISPTELQDNNATISCKVEDSEGPGFFSETALLIVADGSPPAVIPTQVSHGLYDITVAWEPVLVPPMGPVLNYSVVLMGPVQQQLQVGASATSLLLGGLIPASQYSLTVVATNMYGVGNTTSVTVTTKNPVVPSAPENVLVDALPASSALVSWKAVEIDNQTMTPILQYDIAYYPANKPSLVLSKSTLNASELQMMLYNLTLGEVYEIRVSAVNSAGQGAFSSVTVIIDAVNISSSTQATPTSTTPIQLFTQSVLFSSLSSFLVPMSTTTSTVPSFSSTSTYNSVTYNSVTSTSTSSTVFVTTSSSSSPGTSSTIPTSASSTVPTSTSSTSFPSTSSTILTSATSSTFSTSSPSTSSTSSPNTVSMNSHSTSSSSSTITSSTSSTGTSSTSSTHSTTATFTGSVHSSSTTPSISTLPSSSVNTLVGSNLYTTSFPMLSPSDQPTTSSTSSTTTNSTNGLLLIIVPALVAGLLVIAIVIIAVMIIVMCTLSVRKERIHLHDREIQNPSPWLNQRSSLRKWKVKEHEGSLKESSLSSSINKSFGSSDSNEMPALATNGSYRYADQLSPSEPNDSGTRV